MYLGVIEKLGPLARTYFCPSVRLVLERLMTHLLLLLACNWLLLLFNLSELFALLPCPNLLLLMALLLLLLLLLIKLLNFLTCLSLTLPYLSSLTLSMNLLHLSGSVALVTMHTSLDLLLFMVFSLSSIVLLMHLTLSWSSCFFCFLYYFPGPLTKFAARWLKLDTNQHLVIANAFQSE